MPFSMVFQGNNQQNASAMKPAKGKTGEQAVFSPCCGDETTTYYERAFINHRSVQNHHRRYGRVAAEKEAAAAQARFIDGVVKEAQYLAAKIQYANLVPI